MDQQLLDLADPPTNLSTNPPPTNSSTSRQTLAASLYLAGASLEDIIQALEDKQPIDPRALLPRHFHQFLPAFDVAAANTLPPHRECDHSIELKPGTIPPSGPLYNMSIEELQVLRKFLKENLDKGFIRASTSPAASPVLFAKKPGGGLRFCVDYRALNAITIKNRYPLPLLQETLSKLSTAKFYTKLDVIHAFNRIRMKEGQEWMTAFNTRYGLFETLVMPFGLSNAPATFQARINEVLRPFLDIFCTAYIDDILIFSDNLKDHRKHVCSVLQALQDAGLQLDIKKCKFETTEVTYLGMIVSTSGVKMDPLKVQCILDWQAPTTVKDVQGFLGFSNFYRRFIKGFSRIVRPLVHLTKKDIKWGWNTACQKAFDTLKNAFTSAPTLRHFDPSRQIFVETDASDWVSSGILSQKDDDGVLHPVAFMSRKFDPAECNYEIYDKELLAIVRSFESWRAELQGAATPITVLTDHRNLEYFMTTKQLTRRQVRWSEFLSQFDYICSWRPGKQSIKPDALTRRSQDLPSNPSDPRTLFQQQALLKPNNLDSRIRGELQHDPDTSSPESTNLSTYPRPGLTSSTFPDLDFHQELSLAPLSTSPKPELLDHQITRLLDEGYQTDTWWFKIRDEMLKLEGIPHSKEISLSECEIRDGRLYFRNRLYVPDNKLRLLLIQTAHNSAETGHPGKNRLYECLTRDWFWPKLSADTRTFVRNCHSCKRNETSRLRYQGTLKPLPLPIQRWRDISVDFVGPFTHMLQFSEFDTIMVTVDRLTKERHYSPCNSTMKAIDLSKIFLRDIWRLHGLPDTIVSDRGALFVAELWKAVCYRLQITSSLSTAYHPETDGQTEIANAAMEAYLRHYINFAQSDIFDWLPMAEFAANNAVSSSTQVSPFFATRGFYPRMTFGPPRPLDRASSKAIQEQTTIGNDFVTKMEEILKVLQTNLTATYAQQEASANANRSPAPAYRPGDLVFLSTKNFSSIRPSKKLSEKFDGPFKVLEVIGSHSYKLQLPVEHNLVHDTFHTSLLRPAATDPLQGQTNPPPPPVSFDAAGNKLWAIESILDSERTKEDGFRYLIQWRGYSSNHNSWEPLQHVINARASMLDFRRRFPSKPRPSSAEIKHAKHFVAITP